MIARASLLALALAGAACSDPSYGDGHLQCATDVRACPAGFYCAVTDQRCWRAGSGPDLALEADVDMSLSADLAGADLALNASRCGGLSVKLCDGFEAAALDAKWQKSLASGVVTLDSSRAYRGQSAVHLHTNAVGAGMSSVDASIFTSAPLPITGTAYVRAWLYLKTPQPATTTQVINFLDANQGGVAYVVESGGNAGINDYALPQTYTASASTTVPFDRWTCLQMQLAQTAASGDISIFIDGAKVDVMLTGSATPPMNRVAFGLDYYMPPAIAAQDAWLDEVIVDDKPISCSD
jgi:hypothetical protein